MPATIPTPIRDTIANYPPALADSFVASYLQGLPFWLTLPVTFNTTDAAVLFTVPTGVRFCIHRAGWEVGTSWSGGSSSSIGLSSSNAAYNTKGDIQGGSGGDLAAAMTGPGFRGGSAIGAKFATNGFIVLIAADTIRFDRIVSAYTAGTANAQLWCSILPAS